MVGEPGSSLDTTASVGAVRAPIPATVRVLGAVSFAQDAGSEMMYPFLPVFITGVLGAPAVAVGLAEGLADTLAAVMKLVAGRRASTARRRWIASGYGLAAAGKCVVALALVWPVVLLGRAIDRIGKGLRGVPRDAMIVDAVPAGDRGRAFGFHRALDTAGAVVGPLIGLAVFRLMGHRIRPVLVIAVIPAVISVALVTLVRENRTSHQPGHHTAAATAATRVRLPASFWQAMVPVSVFGLVNSTDALLLLRATRLGLDTTSLVLVYVAYNAVYATLAYPAGWLADRLAPRLVFAAGLLVFAIAYLGLGRATAPTAVWILLPMYGAFSALTDGVSRAWIAGLVELGQRTWALGVHGATTGVAVLVAGLWSGLAWNGDGRLPLTVSGIVAFLVAGWLLATHPRAARTAFG